MSDNSTMGGTTDVIRTEDRAGVKTQVVALDLNPAGNESLMTGVMPVSDNGGSLTVDGTVGISGTVPVSGTVTANAGVGPFPVSDNGGSLTVDGIVALSGTSTVTGSGTAGTPAGGVHSVQGISGGTALKVARTIDVTRTLFAVTYNATNAPAADTLLTTLVKQLGGTTTSGQTSIAVTAGKVLRITSIIVGLRTTTAALPWGVLQLRVNHSGAAVIGSPSHYQVPVSGTAAVAGNTGTMSASIEDGLGFSGTMQFGLSFANNVATNVTTVTLLGYEFTP